MLLRLEGDGPKYVRITRALCALIQTGALLPGARLPPTRSLARDLSCSRNLVLLAYEQLTLEGYLVSRGAAGTFVSPDLPLPPSATSSCASLVNGAAELPGAVLTAHGRRATDAAAGVMSAATRRPGSAPIDFIYGLFEPDTRMVTALRRAFATALHEGAFGYSQAAGDERLREQLAGRLRAGRGVSRHADRLLVTSGTQQALDLCARLLVSEGDRVVIEDPTYDGVNSVFAAAGAEIVRVPVDRHGLVVSALPDDGRHVRLVYVTPSHQFPTGAVLSAARRYALLSWARRHHAFVFEDDYDSEIRYTGRRLEALAAIDTDDRVIYCGTFAKSLFPALRLAYLSLPASLVPGAVGCKWLDDRGSSLILQRLVADLMARGDYDRHIHRTHRRYRARRDALVGALRQHLGSAVDVEGAEAGAHVVVWLREFAGNRLPELVTACASRGVGVYPLAGGIAVHAERPLPRPGLLMGYGLVAPEEIERGVGVLAHALKLLAAT